MVNKTLKSKINAIHNQRFRQFYFKEIPTEKKYFEPKSTVFLSFGFLLLLTSVIFFNTDYKNQVLKIAIFALIFSGYKIYQAFFVPILRLDKNGIEVRAIRIPWKNIKKVKLNWKQKSLHLTFNLVNKKVVHEKVEPFNFLEYIYLHQTIRGFKAKYRKKYILKKE